MTNKILIRVMLEIMKRVLNKTLKKKSDMTKGENVLY